MAKNEFLCDCHPIDEQLVGKVKSAMPDACEVRALAAFFKIIGDDTRCRILLALKASRLCVCDLANVLSMTKSSISHQLNKMKSAGVVKCEREGKLVYYSLDDRHVIEIFDVSASHIKHKVVEQVYEK